MALRVKRVTAVAAVVLAAALLWKPLTQVGGLALGGATIALLLSPLCAFFEKRLSRPMSALAAVLTACAALALLVGLLLPVVVREIVQLGETLPRSIRRVAQWADAVNAWTQSRLTGVRLPELPLDAVSRMVTGFVTQAVAAVGSLADGFSRLSMMLMLACFFLTDRDRLLLRLELLVPRAIRPAAVRAGRGVIRELRLYAQGELMIAGAVAALSAAGLMLIGMRSALVLGGIVGLLNMVPYFGPFIGGIPAVLIALGDGFGQALLCAGVLGLVQQADASLLSPRIMGGLTGFSPASVLLAIYAGGSLGGIGGMLLALPAAMSIRTVFRVFVQSHENI